MTKPKDHVQFGLDPGFRIENYQVIRRLGSGLTAEAYLAVEVMTGAGAGLAADVMAVTPFNERTILLLQSDGGWDYKVTIGALEKSGKALLAQIVALKKGELGGIVIVIADGIETMQKYSDPFGSRSASAHGAS